ncbi:hypothetical protein ACFWIY_23965 [Streptomyces sioyaensis]|uniref:hypothetical protein n=1 Tax=Streptomyces sioyaensis TaxID=67364 RepID=UPI00364612AA
MRTCLIYALSARLSPFKDLDDAYWDALEAAGPSGKGSAFLRVEHISFMRADWGYEIQLPEDGRLVNSAYQNFTAGRLAGIDEVGHEVFGQALIDLGWAKESNVDQAVSYFKGAYQSPKSMVSVLRDHSFGEIFKYARKAGILEAMWANGGKFTRMHADLKCPKRIYDLDLRCSDLSWILDIPPGHGDSRNIHHAIVSNLEFKGAIDSVIP